MTNYTVSKEQMNKDFTWTEVVLGKEFTAEDVESITRGYKYTGYVVDGDIRSDFYERVDTSTFFTVSYKVS